jgi:NADH dehydrogenase
MLAAIDRQEAQGKTYEIGGPQVKSFRELMEFMLATIERRRLLVPIPFGPARLIAAALELAGALHKPLLTRDQVELLRSDNVVSEEASREGRTLAGLGIAPIAMAAEVPAYLWRFRKAGQFQRSEGQRSEIRSRAPSDI